MYFILFLFIKKFYFFSERGKGGGKRERRTDVQEKHSGVPRAPPAGDPGPDPGVGRARHVCPQAGARPAEPHQPGQDAGTGK